ncbi:T-cell surface glycoprotein CD1b-3-like isoform X1 [Rhea pennata]|uniref:T-cell surface glycoprotein CD1b-3-like isoform X1 n=1 Tax=Rhea pennata TaxID=8795 RepID=UPI002E2687CF
MLTFLLLLPIIVPGTVLEAMLPPAVASHALHIFLTLAFPNSMAVEVTIYAALDDVIFATQQQHTGEIVYLRPWVHPALPESQWEYLHDLFKIYVHNLILLLNGDAKQHHEPYPFVYQSVTGCDLHSNGSYTRFYRLSYNGRDLITFDVDRGRWENLEAGKVATRIATAFHDFIGFSVTLQYLLNDTCKDHMKKLILSGKKDLERQVKPAAVVFARTPEPGRLLLVCRVTGFYPRPVSVTWLRDGEEVPPGPELNSTPILPNADLTYQMRSVLAAAPRDGHSYACRVRHSSLGDYSLLLHWAPASPKPQHVAWIVIAVILAASAAVAGAVWWWRRR